MSFVRSLYEYFKEWLCYLTQFLILCLKSKFTTNLEIIALRSQLALYVQQHEKEKLPKPRPTPAFRQLWVFISKYLDNWREVLLVVNPDTVTRWHRTALKFYWKQKSKKIGRPMISPATINLIKRVHKDNPLLSPEKIHEKLRILGIEKPSAPNTLLNIFLLHESHLLKNRFSHGRHF